MPRMRTRTIRRILMGASPRSEVCERLGISEQLGSDIALGKRIGATHTLVHIADVLGLSDRELGASVRENVEFSGRERLP